MLFPDERILKLRIKVAEAVTEHGAARLPELCAPLFKLDPDDPVALLAMGTARMMKQDVAGAMDYLWRALEAQPCSPIAYGHLAALLESDREDALPLALRELSLRMAQIGSVDIEDDDLPDLEELSEIQKLPPEEKLDAVISALQIVREAHPHQPVERVRRYFLLSDLVDGLSKEQVDSILSDGPAMAPVLIGALRGWAQGLIHEDFAALAENSLALLGEIGDPSALPYLFECTANLADELGAAADWAIDRVIQKDPEGARKKMAEILSAFSPNERVAAVAILFRNPRLDPDGAVLLRLGQNLKSTTKNFRDLYFPFYLPVLLGRLGPQRMPAARDILTANAALLSKSVRAEMEAFLDGARHTPLPQPKDPEPSPWTVYDICSGEAELVPNEDEDEDENEDNDEDFEDQREHAPLAPIVTMPSPGRNDPCWCGSGKKYKKCHLDADRHEASSVGRDESAFDELRFRLRDFMMETISEPDKDRALQEFFGDSERSDSEAVAVADWMIHDWVPAEFGRGVIPEFLRRHGSSLLPRERALLENWSKSYVGLYEILKVDEGTGVELKNLFTDEVRFIRDVKMSRSVVRWDGLLARVVETEVGLGLTGIGLRIPRGRLREFQDWLEEDRSRTRLPWPEYMKRNLAVVRRRPQELGEEWMSGLKMQNTDGEELLFSKAVFDVRDVEVVRTALAARPDFSEDEEGATYTWLPNRPAQGAPTVHGTVRIYGSELTFECNSMARLDRGKALLSKLGGSELEHVRDEFTTMQEMKRSALENPEPAKSGKDEIPREIQDEIVSRYYEDHYGKWPDMTLPALGGKTPRQAMKTPRGRREVIELLRQFENGEETKRKNGEPYYDMSRLRAELGVKE